MSVNNCLCISTSLQMTEASMIFKANKDNKGLIKYNTVQEAVVGSQGLGPEDPRFPCEIKNGF